MTLVESDALLNDPAVMTRVRMAVLTAGAAVFGEDPATPSHAERLLWAAKVIGGDGLSEARVARFLAVQPNAQEKLATDAALVAWVSGLVTALAKLPTP